MDPCQALKRSNESWFPWLQLLDQLAGAAKDAAQGHYVRSRPTIEHDDKSSSPLNGPDQFSRSFAALELPARLLARCVRAGLEDSGIDRTPARLQETFNDRKEMAPKVGTFARHAKTDDFAFSKIIPPCPSSQIACEA